MTNEIIELVILLKTKNKFYYNMNNDIWIMKKTIIIFNSYYLRWFCWLFFLF